MTSVTIIQAIIAAATAIFVAAVGYYQWRTAEQKAVLDLFDRRRAIYDVVHSCVLQMISSSPGFDQQRETEFLRAKEQAYFFFGDDVQTYLEQLWQDIIDVRAADEEQKGPLESSDRTQTIQRRRTALNRISKFYQDGKPLFGKYMRFSQPVRLGVLALATIGFGRLRDLHRRMPWKRQRTPARGRSQ
jgi:hypothetical protein